MMEERAVRINSTVKSIALLYGHGIPIMFKLVV